MPDPRPLPDQAPFSPATRENLREASRILSTADPALAALRARFAMNNLGALLALNRRRRVVDASDVARAALVAEAWTAAAIELAGSTEQISVASCLLRQLAEVVYA